MTSDERHPREGVEGAEGWEAASLAEVAHALSAEATRGAAVWGVGGMMLVVGTLSGRIVGDVSPSEE